MKLNRNFLKLIKISTKAAFDSLKSESPIICKSLDTNIFVTRIFLNHIRFEKRRVVSQINERLLLINLVPQILFDGQLIETRQQKNYIFYEIAHLIENIDCRVIIRKNLSGKYYLFSCFINKK